jgi:hypothetical protein
LYLTALNAGLARTLLHAQLCKRAPLHPVQPQLTEMTARWLGLTRSLLEQVPDCSAQKLMLAMAVA